jgi:hypothetical protein
VGKEATGIEFGMHKVEGQLETYKYATNNDPELSPTGTKTEFTSKSLAAVSVYSDIQVEFLTDYRGKVERHNDTRS